MVVEVLIEDSRPGVERAPREILFELMPRQLFRAVRRGEAVRLVQRLEGKRGHRRVVEVFPADLRHRGGEGAPGGGDAVGEVAVRVGGVDLEVDERAVGRRQDELRREREEDRLLGWLEFEDELDDM